MSTSSPHNPSKSPLPAATLPVELGEHLLTSVVESANDAIVTKTLDGIITSWNPAAQRIFGYTAEEIVGQSVMTIIPPDRRHEEKLIIGRILAGERVEHYETLRRRKDGRLIDISLTVSPIMDAAGNIRGASKIAREITDIKRASRDLEESQRQYRTLFESIDEGFCVLEVIFNPEGEAVDWRYREVNPAFVKQSGLSEPEGRLASELMPTLEPYWFEIYGQVAQTGQPVRSQRWAQPLGRWFDLYAFRIGQPEENLVAIIFNDVTEKVNAEHERLRLLEDLKAERSKLAYLFEKAPAFAATLRGPDHVFELVNPAYTRLIGHREVVGKTAREAFPDVSSSDFIDLLDNVYTTGRAHIGREVLVQLQPLPGKPAEEHYVDLVYQPIFETDGTVGGTFVHGVEITAQVRARKEAESANRAKDEFLATLSHELRTPLNAILGWSELLSTNELDEETRLRAQDTIRRNAKIQVQLIDDILDVSRIISGKLKLEVRPLELAPVVEAAAEAVLPAAEAKGIRLQRILDYGSCLVSGDPDRLQQVVWNLLSNAIKFTPKHGRVQIRIERINSHVEIVVSDTGMGIPYELIPYVFDRFRQADSTTTRQFGGLGLGLAIVRHLVEMHGGTVEAESPGEGQGATFTVKLPLVAVRRGNGAKVHPTARRDVGLECPPELEGLRVLVVDDEEDARTLVETVLKSCGAHVTTVSTVSEALTVLEQSPQDVLVSDLGMPDEDGYSLIKKVRALPPEQGGNIPAAALTAFARLEDRMRVLRSGFHIHLPKPVEPAELLAVVASLGGRTGYD